jgi:hypothetical protein
MKQILVQCPALYSMSAKEKIRNTPARETKDLYEKLAKSGAPLQLLNRDAVGGGCE